MTHTETCGENSLKQIFVASEGGDSEAVVRWCENCGAVVVDRDFDGRTNAGAIMPMQFPLTVRGYNATS